MSEKFWEPTAKMFSSLFERPRMTEQHLTRPPFKYLFDIILRTIKVTGFGSNLYKDEELQADFSSSKAGKLKFLEIIITFVGAALNEKIDVNPGQIIAGVEPEKTNLFLQKLYKAATTKTQPTNSLPSEIPPEKKESKIVFKPRGIRKETEKPKDDFPEQIETIQKTIQSLAANVGPLGRTLNYVDDDIQIMNQEMQKWRNQRLSSNQEHQLELQKTDEELVPLQSKLGELLDQIESWKLKIKTTKSTVAQNEQIIQRLLLAAVK